MLSDVSHIDLIRYPLASITMLPLSQAGKVQDGSARQNQSAIVNNYFQHDARGKLVAVGQDAPFFQELMKKQSRFFDDSHEGAL